MSDSFNKVDMSLDDIIKLNKSENKHQIRRSARGRAGVRGRGIPARGREGARGLISRGRGLIRSRGGISRGARLTVNPVRQFRGNLQRGRLGRGRGLNRLNAGVSPLNRNRLNQPSLRGNVRRAGSNRGGRVFTNSRLRQQQGIQHQSLGQQQTAQQRQQRLDKTRQQAALLREKQLALKNLQLARQNVLSINQALQKTSRDNLVNQRRNIGGVQLSALSGNRGRRKLLTPLRRPNIDPVNNMATSALSRQLSHTSVTIANPTVDASLPFPGRGRGRRRRPWRRNSVQSTSSEHFTIQVANQNLQSVTNPQSSVLNQLKLLKPAVTTVYKFQKNVFASSATGLSLNDRFSASPSYAGDASSLPEDRKVFI